MDKKKLNAKDFINIGIFTVIYFVMFFITGMLGYIPIVGQCPLLSDGTKLDFNSVWNRIRFPG